ncbi:MAG: response regulator [Calditrichaeota bacterium]|nr:response regulator [Calditrichota bacterium]
MDEKQKHLLAIDDEPVILDAIKKIGAAEGWRVDTAADATSGLHLVQKHVFDLCLCDIKLPDLDGFGFLDELRRMNVDLAVIMTTGYATVENAVQSLELGAIDYLPKPFTVDEVLSALYRGFRYVELISKLRSAKPGLDSMIVPCPIQYRRLGYGSWCFIENDGSVKIGVSDLFLKIVDPIRALRLQPVESEITQGFSCAEVEADDELVHPVMAPISGQIISVNQKLEQDPSLTEKDPYFEGWLYTIIPKNLNYELKYLTACNQAYGS